MTGNVMPSCHPAASVLSSVSNKGYVCASLYEDLSSRCALNKEV